MQSVCGNPLEGCWPSCLVNRGQCLSRAAQGPLATVGCRLLQHAVQCMPGCTAGRVFEGKWAGVRVAVKCLTWAQLAGQPYGSTASGHAFLSGAAPLAALKHPNLVEVGEGPQVAASPTPPQRCLTAPLSPWLLGAMHFPSVHVHFCTAVHLATACLHLQVPDSPLHISLPAHIRRAARACSQVHHLAQAGAVEASAA